jgi:hypothetical protein
VTTIFSSSLDAPVEGGGWSCASAGDAPAAIAKRLAVPIRSRRQIIDFLPFACCPFSSQLAGPD